VIEIANPINQLLKPFEDMDIASAYQQHYLLIDFVIYVLIFVGLSRFVFARKFPGRSGKAISIGMGVALSIGLSVFSYTSGFSLARFGPLAAIFLLILTAFMIVGLIKQFGGNSTTSGIIAFIVTYFITRAAFPEIYEWTQKTAFGAWIDAALMISIPILLALLTLHAMHHFTQNSSINRNREMAHVKTEKPDPLNFGFVRKLENESLRTDKQVMKNEKAVVGDIKSIISLLKSGRITAEIQSKIRAKLDDLHRRDNIFRNMSHRLKLLNQKLVDSEINTLEKASISEGLSSSQDQSKLKRIAISEKKSIVDNRKIRALQESVDQKHQQFIKRIKMSINELEQRNNNEALRNLVHAQEIEEDSRKLLKDIRRLHKQLMQITKNEKHTVKELA